MTTTVCDAVRSAGDVTATLSADVAGNDLFSGAGWLSTAVSEALEARAQRVLAPQR